MTTRVCGLGIRAIPMGVCSDYIVGLVKSSEIRFWPGGSPHISQSPRHYRAKGSSDHSETCEDLPCDDGKMRRIDPATFRLAQDALLDYLHCTRNFPFTDAEYISRNSPRCLEKLLVVADAWEDVSVSLARFLRYNPINEFEPFFESVGLRPSEYAPLLPRNRLFLSDDQLLIENYHVLCDYGIEHRKIGKIYKEAPEIFKYDHGVLSSKINAYEELGLTQSTMPKIIVSSPYLLIGDLEQAFVEVLEQLGHLGFRFTWIEEHVSEKVRCKWNHILEVLCFFRNMGFTEEQLGELISQHPGILFEGSGDQTLSLIGFLLKFGSPMREIQSVFLQFPQIPIGKFFSNIRRCFLLLIEIDMEAEEVNSILRTYVVLLGTCTIKKPNSLFVELNVGKKRLCKIIKDDPTQMKNWVVGQKIEHLPDVGENGNSLGQKIKFLLGLGFGADSCEVTEALKVFRGKGEELQERFDCLVQAGLDRKDVIQMITVCPKILNMSKDLIEMKIEFLVNDLGYPLSTLVAFPAFLGYSLRRVKLRHCMYSWLRGEGIAEPCLAFSNIVSCSDRKFVIKFVNRHPSGPQVWQDLKENLAVV